MGIPNLDAMNEEELHTFARQMAGLRSYAWWKSHAIFERKIGDIPQALVAEQECDRIYKQLPEWARW